MLDRFNRHENSILENKVRLISTQLAALYHLMPL